jgi:hypothetical protein
VSRLLFTSPAGAEVHELTLYQRPKNPGRFLHVLTLDAPRTVDALALEDASANYLAAVMVEMLSVDGEGQRGPWPCPMVEIRGRLHLPVIRRQLTIHASGPEAHVYAILLPVKT